MLEKRKKNCKGREMKEEAIFVLRKVKGYRWLFETRGKEQAPPKVRPAFFHVPPHIKVAAHGWGCVSEAGETTQRARWPDLTC